MKFSYLSTRLLALPLLFGSIASASASSPEPWGAVPTPQQVEWQRLEFYGFIHFGLNTFTGREWGYGDESPSIFNPNEFDADKALTQLKAGGMKGVIYTAKHHDGWCAWPTKTTEHNISASPYKNGKGDIVKELSQAAHKNGILFGTYLSPWDRNHADYGREGYLKVYYEQITELLSNYGSIFEIWFDGANGGDGYYGGAREFRSIGDAATYYNFERIVSMIRKLQPNTIIWGAGSSGDARWGGSEKGFVDYPHSHTIDNGTRWVPAEGDTPINHAGWFWHKGQEKHVKSPQELMKAWFESVGRGANLILNVALNDKGQFDDADVQALHTFKQVRDELYKKDYALGATPTQVSETRENNQLRYGAQLLFDGDIESYWCPDDDSTTGSIIATLPQPAIVDVVRIREQIRLGQRVSGWTVDIQVDGEWKQATKGQSIGNQVLFRFDNCEVVTAVRLNITQSAACPTISELSLFKMPDIPEPQTAANAGISKKNWRIVDQPANTEATKAIDGDASTFWHTHPMSGELNPPQSLTVDMGAEHEVTGFSYLPRQDGTCHGMTDRYILELSSDGKHFTTVAEGEFGNLRANPVAQLINLCEPTKARYFRFTGTRSLEKNHVSVAEIGIFTK